MPSPSRFANITRRLEDLPSDGGAAVNALSGGLSRVFYRLTKLETALGYITWPRMYRTGQRRAEQRQKTIEEALILDETARHHRIGHGFIGMTSGEEKTYFHRAFEALGVTQARRAADPDTQPTAGFKAIMREAAQTRSYAAALSVLVVAE